MGDILFVVLLIIPIFYGALTDYRYRIIPNCVSPSILIVGLSSMVFLPNDSSFFVPLWLRAAGVLPAVLMLFIAYFKGGIGGGDIKLMAALGFSIGLYTLVPVLFIATITAVLWAKIQKEKSVPLGFFLFIGTFIFRTMNLFPKC